MERSRPNLESKMNVRRVAGTIRAGCVAGIIAFNVVALAEAEEAIGVAAVVRNQVDQALPTRVIPINVGENITRDEVVKTGMESAAKLVFSDNTNLSMGPGSAVTLNKFVYSGAGSYEKATFQLVKGAFRFTTGGSDKRAYEIKTPTATIGVRGTILDIRVDPLTFNTLVLLQEGAADVCIIPTRRDRENGRSAARCQHLTQVGQTATATSTSVSNTGPGGAGGWNFSDSVGQDPSLLQATVFAAATSPSGQNGDGHDGSGPGSFGPMGSGSGGGGGGGSVFPSTGGGSSGSPPSTGGPPASPN
jgi:FecR protein